VGIYSTLESKWYSAIEAIDGFIPVAGLTDKVDEKVPSFIVFIAVVLLIILFLLFLSFTNSEPVFDVEVTVLNQIGLPIENAKVDFQSNCDGSEMITDSSGKVMFTVCGETVDVQISKEGFKGYSNTFDVKDKLSIKLSKSVIVNPVSRVTILVDDGADIISKAGIDVVCDGSVVNTFSNQTNNGFSFDAPVCSNLQIKAAAVGYIEKTIILNASEERRTIHLEKLTQTGEITFYSNNELGEISGVEITLRPKTGGIRTLFTIDGVVIENLEIGEYDYTALYDGELLVGNFTINPNDSKKIYLTFADSSQVSPSNIKYLAVETVSNDAGISAVEVKFFKNGKQMASRRTNALGKTTPMKINLERLEEGAVFKGIINAVGYEAKFFDLDLVNKDEYQKIVLSQGGGELNLKLVNDLGVSEKNAFVVLNYAGFEGIFKSGYSDSNGKLSFVNLPPGNYSIKAYDEDKMDEANISVVLAQDEIKDLEIMLRTGEGRIKFGLFDYLGDKVDAYYEMYVNDGNGFRKNSEGLTKRGYVISEKLLVGTKIKLRVTDGNFIPHETITYIVDRSTQDKEVYLRKVSELPNDNTVQMFLMNVYDSNPLYGKSHKASKILAGSKYYLYFDVVLNNQNQNGLVSNFSVTDEDQNDPFPISINDSYSIDGASKIMSASIGDFLIPQTSAVESAALQLNVSFANKTGVVSIPIIMVVDIDQNAVGKKKINFESMHGSDASLSYEREFTIGESFCIYDCPIFMFSNYLRWENKPVIPLTDAPQRVFIGDHYYIQTKVHNLSDGDIGDAVFSMTVPKEKLNYLTFENDANRVTQQVNLTPISESNLIEKEIVLKKATNSAKVYGAVEQMVNGIDVLKHYEGNDNEIRLLIKRKEELEIDFSPNILDQDVEYPQFLVKTKYRSKYKGVSAYWKAEKVTLGGDLILTQGQTDVNGIEELSFSTRNLNAGDVIKFTAWDLNGAIDGVKTITIQNPFPRPPPIVPECLKVLVGGVELDENNSIFGLNLNSTKQFSIRSDCNVLRRVDISTKQYMVTGITYDINAGETKNLSVQAKAIGGVLGVYPINIVSSNQAGVVDLGTIDVVVSDPNSCFDLKQAVFDLRNTGKISSKVINKCYVGRFNNFYPKMDVDTSSVSVQFNKPGNPEHIDFNAMVIGSAMEGLVQGGIYANKLSTSSKQREYHNPVAYAVETEDPYRVRVNTAAKVTSVDDLEYLDYYQSYCSEWYYDSWTNPKPEPDSNSYWGQFSDPLKPTYRFPDYDSYNQDDLVLTPKYNETGGTGSPTDLQGIGTTRRDSSSISVTTPANANTLPYGKFENNTATVPAFYNVGTSGGNVNFGPGYCSRIDGLAPAGTTNNARYNVPYRESSYVMSLFFGPGSTCDTPTWTDPGTATFDPAAGETYDTAVWDAEGGMRVVNDGSGRSANTIFSGHDFHSQEKWYKNAPYGIGVGDGGEKWYSIASRSHCGSDGSECKILEMSTYTGNKNYIRVKTEGKWSCLWCTADTTRMSVQIEGMRRLDPLMERRSSWTQEVHLKTIEGAVQKIGGYSGTPVPEWTNIDSWPDGLKAGEGKQMGNTYFAIGCVNPNGLVPPEWPNLGSYKGCVVTPGGDTLCEQNAQWGHVGVSEFFPHYVVRPPEDPLVEYDYTGTIMYYIPQDTIPGWVEGAPKVRMFLSGGEVYAEYVGVSEVAGNSIDFNITKNDLLGEEYATLTVSDWVSDTNIQTQKFNIKLTGQDHTCYASDGTEGFVGASFVPKLLFDWDWNSVAQNQCDSTNWNYTYCDATQFTISLSKKLQEIEDLIKLGRINEIPQKTTFYSYLLRDNFSNDFLVDFENHYSNTLLNAGTQFSNLKNLINNNKLVFKQRLADGSTLSNNPLPFGGLYRVEIDIDMINENLQSLFNGTTPNADITVKLGLIKKASNYNPFYELPFNGSISNAGTRTNYGVSVEGDSLVLNNSGTNAGVYSGALKTITGLKSDDLVELDKGIVFAYDVLTDNVYYLPSQPTPVLMSVTNTVGSSVIAAYKFEGTGSTSPLQKNWRMTSSTIGNATCYDFDNQDKKSFTDSISSSGINRIKWTGKKGGSITLSTVFLTPKNVVDTQRVTPANAKTSLISYPALQNSNTMMLNNYDVLGISDYDSIKGLFTRIGSGDMCLSKDSTNTMKIWWNPEYLDGLTDEIGSTSGSSC
jgi:hypothetical protein